MVYLRVLSQYQASQFLANTAIRHLLNKQWHFLSKEYTLCTTHVGSGKQNPRMTNFVKARLRNYTWFTEQKNWYQYWQYHKISTANINQHQSRKLNLKRGCIMLWNSKHNNPQCSTFITMTHFNNTTQSELYSTNPKTESELQKLCSHIWKEENCS